ncbi:RHOMBOID-like protein 5 [Magnolia sinica]|uniref:RHOMBOID-like protein 5 n=1 Tax=Magnolia sinica TaxID=86752 RepID=UPI002658B1E6|nr:RHOMBOID-like protein 5 [Magnolia sinica]XP_058074469.1 RHOMBOID-like protein 5 [Magnolia sinica]
MGKRPPSPSAIIELGPQSLPPPHPSYTPHVPQEPWTPWLVPIFVIVNLVAFGLTMYVNDCPSTTGAHSCLFSSPLGRFSFEPLSVNPLFGPSLETLDQMGALDWKKVVKEGEGWRLISCIWLHAGVIHLLANMLSLLFIGIRLEQEFGFLRIGLLYTLSGFGGSLSSSLSSQIHRSISVGASGALFGLLGAMLSELITNWTIYANKFAALLTLVIIIAINLAVGLVPHVDSSAHIGGFISGFLLGFILLIRPQFGWVSRKHIPPGYNMDLVKPKHKVYQYLLWFTAFVLLLAGYAGGLVKLFDVGPYAY